MKITKNQLKKIIKEELENVMDEGIFDRVKKAFGKGTPVEPAAGTPVNCDDVKAKYDELEDEFLSAQRGMDAFSGDMAHSISMTIDNPNCFEGAKE